MHKLASLPPNLIKIIQNKGTEIPSSGEYDTFDKQGSYLCRQCGLALFRAKHKFHSGCGWPSFDSHIKTNVKKKPDPDGTRTEIVCNRCAAHLGHVFTGENYTSLNTRHCVNSASLDFVADTTVEDTEEAILAGGCFWGVEYYFKKLDGVLKVSSGYTGGNLENPGYQQVCQGNTGHIEAVRIVFDKQKTTYEDVVKYFFEIHNPTQQHGQGPDIGSQYISACFYYDETQHSIIKKLISILEDKGLKITTKIFEVTTFWQAEQYHQDYYTKHPKVPYCHSYTKRF